MAVTKSIISCTPYVNSSSKVDKGDIQMKYENGSEGDSTYYTSIFSTTVNQTDTDASGNTTTNFGSAKNGRVNLGSLNSNGEAIPQNSTIKVVFAGNVDSTIGLVNIFNTDAASTSGLQQILKLQ